MTGCEIVLACVFMIISVGFFLVSCLACKIQFRIQKGETTAKKLSIPTALLLLSVFFSRYSVGLYENYENEIRMGYFELVFDSFVRAFQTFSLDESYTERVIAVKFFFENKIGSPCWASFYGLFVTLLNVCAPVVGGTILLGILTSFFPRLRLGLIRCTPFREIYVFSELNNKAIALAEDIKKKNKGKGFLKSPLIVFTDAYVDEKKEESSELLQKAKILGAICIKDDILKLKFPCTKQLHYILIDEADINNIHTLTTLVTEENKRWKQKSQTGIFVFSQNSEANSIVRKLYKQKQGELENVLIMIVQEYTNIVYDLFDKMPLYYPLLTKYYPGFSGEKELVLTIIGGGQIGTEIFLCAYWCAQMLNCKLTINVITEKADNFEEKIKQINPEILKSGIVFREYGIEEADKELLLKFPNDKLHEDSYADPYACFTFTNVDVKTSKLFEELERRRANKSYMLASDYFVVALGSDEMNMTIAAEINRKIQKAKLSGDIANPPVIAYSVYDSETNKALNTLDTTHSSNATLHAFAALSDIYSYETVFMKSTGGKAHSIHKGYAQKKVSDQKKVMNDFRKDEYKFWSSIARFFHIKYKIYSAGLLGKDKNENDKKDGPGYISQKEYKDFINIANNKDAPMFKKLTWLEHRRWNAYMRTKGFSAPTDEQFMQYSFNEDIEHKHIDLRLHPCIVESSEKSSIEKSDWTNTGYESIKEKDRLDIISIKIDQKKREKDRHSKEGYTQENYKEYDGPDDKDTIDEILSHLQN